MTGALDYLTAQSFNSLLVLFWFVAVFEIPRYLLLFGLTVFLPRRGGGPDGWRPQGTVSAVVVGHSEESKVVRCVQALREQSHPPNEIVVLSDGSTDGMALRLADLQRRGLVDAAHATELRSGKAAGLNLGVSVATGDFVVLVDCDCTFDRHAFRNVLRPFADPGVGAVSGSVLVRNARSSVLATFQAIEYIITISLGKQAMDRLDLVSCISGAFGAFRRSAYEEVGGHDAGGGEDLDLTLSLRAAGWRVRFAGDAVCHTDVPATCDRLVRQRFRWERDAVRLRYRKHASMMNPFSPRFSWSELAHEAEFLLFNVIAAAALPVYFIWLFAMYGDLGLMVLLGAQFGLICLDILVFLLAAIVTPHVRALPLLPFVVGFSLYYGFFMRFVRLVAYVDEWIFRASYRDAFVPQKVHKVRG